MVLKQYYLNCLAHASYVIADEHTPVWPPLREAGSGLSCISPVIPFMQQVSGGQFPQDPGADAPRDTEQPRCLCNREGHSGHLPKFAQDAIRYPLSSGRVTPRFLQTQRYSAVHVVERESTVNDYS